MENVASCYGERIKLKAKKLKQSWAVARGHYYMKRKLKGYSYITSLPS